jgi:diacylglycerol kinase (ATP)
LDVLRILRAARYSASGLRATFQSDAAFRQELLIGVVLVPAAVWLGDSGLERAALVASLLLVLIVELLNTAVENVVDRVGTEPNDLSGRAKDVASAAVFLSLVNVPVVWGFVLLG